jgi:hypothetical protein
LSIFLHVVDDHIVACYINELFLFNDEKIVLNLAINSKNETRSQGHSLKSKVCEA